MDKERPGNKKRGLASASMPRRKVKTIWSDGKIREFPAPPERIQHQEQTPQTDPSPLQNPLENI
jgi:hypothetical protein